KTICREGGVLFIKKFRRLAPLNSYEEAATSFREKFNYNFAPLGVDNSNSPA
ncbi:hypothetical protein QR685DRAFT_439849, partial [Neurospora intermedia]